MADKVLIKVLAGQSDRSVRYDELAGLLRRLGFVERTGRGSHRVFNHPQIAESVTLVEKRGNVPPAYVREVRGLLTRAGLD